MHSHTNISQVTMFSTMGNLNEGVAGRQDQNHTHKTGMCSAPSAISEWSRHGLKEDRHQSRHGLKKDKIQVRTSVRSYSWSDNAPCTLIQQGHQRKKWVYQKVLHNTDTSFSDPVDMFLSDAESFNEDDMYGSDHGMETVSESSDEENEAEILQSPEGRLVSAWTLPTKSDDLTSVGQWCL